MNIIILGAGQVGGTLAENLAREENDITVIDTNSERLRDLQNRLDIGTVVGSGSYPPILQQAGAKNADMLIAVTNSDEVNLVACQIAYQLFRTPTKIARVRAQEYLTEKENLFGENRFEVDVLISPEQLVTDYIIRLIEHPGSLQVLDFAQGKVQLVALRAYFGGLLVGKTLGTLKAHLRDYKAQIVAIYRSNRSVALNDDTLVEIGDEVFFVAASTHIRDVMSVLRRLETPYKRIMIAGGGNIGYRLARSLENDYQVKILERGSERAKHIAEKLNKTVVLLGDASDRELLINENIDNIDMFCAVTNDDEVNIMSCLQAKRLGAKHVMALITRTAYVDLIEGGTIDIAFSPQQATIGSILTHIRPCDIANVHSLRRGAAEAIEIVAHGDEKTSSVIGRTIGQIKFPKDTNIGAIVRKEKVLIPDADTTIEPNDHIILFLVDKRHLIEVERLFQVSVAFL
ncbi:MAG: Trk system potassium transporter TrkA [Alphaproteobacteria bacterium]|nr:Trk system potassium transporter TrkA [Alphaproteobacteria bacterium]